MIVLNRQLIMLQLIIVLHVLCFVPGNCFPQRNKPNSESHFDFDAYLGHFAPMKHTVNDHPRFLPNQDYRYIPLLGERLDYVPPIIHNRGHITHPNIPKRTVKHRAWHSNYQNGNFPTPAIQHVKKRTQGQNMMQTHKRELHQPVTDISMPTSNFKFRPHIKMEDFGDYEAPVVLESIVKKEIPIFRQQSDDYDIPVVLESIVKMKMPDSIEQNNQNLNSAVPPKEIHDVKDLDYKKQLFIEPSTDEDYEVPVVLEAMIKKQNPDSKSPHKKPIIKTPEIYHSSFSEDYDEPIVLEALTKVNQQLHKKRHGHKKPTKAKPVVNQNIHTNLIVKPVDKIVSPSYQEDYEAQIVVEAFPKEESVHTKGHDNKLVKEKPLKKPDLTNTVVKPVKKTESSYFEDYKSQIVLEAFNKEESRPSVLTEEHGYESKDEAKPVTKKHDERIVIANPAEKTLVTSYTEDEYEAPIVLESLTKEGLFHKEHDDKKSSVMKPEKPEAAKQVVRSTEKPITREEYKYEELEHFTMNGEDEYDIPAVVGSDMHGDLSNYDYEDSEMIEDLTQKEEHRISKEHDHKSVIVQPSMKIHPEIMNENYEKISNFPSVNKETSKEITKIPATKETKKRIVKREIKVDYEDYDLPIVLESIKHPTVPKELGIKTSDEMSSDYEDYDTPIRLESIFKGNNPATHTHTKPEKVDKPKVKHPIDYYDYEEPVVLESIFKKNPGVATGHKPASGGPTDNSYDYELPVIVKSHIKKTGTSEHKIETAELLSEMSQVNPEDYDTPIVLDSFDKEGVKIHKPAVKPEIKIIPTPVENTVIEKKPHDVYNRNKREREQHMEFPKLVNSMVSQDAYERPIDEVAKHGYEFYEPQRPDNYFDEWEHVPKRNQDNRNLESLGLPDNQVVLDSITINRENSDGHEVPFLEVLSIEDKADGGRDTGVKVMTFNQENGDVDSFNLGHVDSNHEIGELGDEGSGSVIDERSLSRSFLPLDANSWSFMNNVQAQERRKFKRCTTPRNETGNCMPVQMCPVPNAGKTVDDFLKNVCIIDEVFIGICCPEFPVETVRVDWGKFDGPDTEPLVDNVEETKECGKLSSPIGDKDSWPWMAPLVSSTSDKVFCGGALITEHYVLTAAHCTSRIPRNQILVRLGNLDSRQTSRDFAVVEIKRHAQYNPRTMQNDIALLKLSRRVPLGNFRKLICLPESEEEDNVGETAILLRWQKIAEKGAVESLPVISNHNCQNRLSTLIGDSVLCTDARNDEALCNADSGAPLVISKDGTFKVIGVLTWNRNDCDGRFPTVFTRISSYRKWILKHAA